MTDAQVIADQISATQKFIAEMTDDLRHLDGVLIGNGWVVMSSGFNLRFTLKGSQASNPQVHGGSPARAQRFTERDARQLAAQCTNGHGEPAEAVHVKDALRAMIADQNALLDTLRAFA